MKFRRTLAALAVLLMTVLCVPSLAAFAESDVDFTIKVDTDIQYIAGDVISCPIVINNQTDKGYVELELFLTFDPDALNCLSIFNDVNGVSTEIRERDGKNGLYIHYLSPDGSTSKKAAQYVMVEFAVITGVASGDYTLSLEVLSCYGYDSVGNKEDAVQKENILTLSMAKDKKLTIVETNDSSVGGGTGDGSDPNYYYTEPSVTQEVDNKNSGCSNAGKAIGLIFGAVVIFGAGVIVGFVLCQKRMNEDVLDSRSSEPAAAPRRFASSAEGFESAASKFSGSVYDDPEDMPSTDYYNDRIAGRKAAPPRRPAATPSYGDEDIDTSYFGRAAEGQLGGSRAVYDDVFKDDYAPSGRSSGYTQEPADDDYGSYDFVGGRRHERTDDGYGSFTSNSSDDDPDDGDNGGYRSDRRRYR